MARRRKTPRPPRRKPVKVQFVPRPDRKRGVAPDPKCPYTYLDDMLRHHDHLKDAKICCAWMHDLKADKDGFLKIGECRKGSDLDRELQMVQACQWDWVLMFNSSAWGMFDEKQRAAVVDHQLHHCQVATDKNGEVLEDERGRTVYRKRKHDIEEFRGVVKRHGLYTDDLQLFAQTCMEKYPTPLFPDKTLTA